MRPVLTAGNVARSARDTAELRRLVTVGTHREVANLLLWASEMVEAGHGVDVSLRWDGHHHTGQVMVTERVAVSHDDTDPDINTALLR